ncbi:MAG: ATP-binding cassette domain-containing protein [Rubrivivax sp.]
MLDAIVEAIDVTHRYAGVLALDRLSIAIARGSFSGIFGPNGAGKSTLSQVLGGMLVPTAGRVTRSSGARMALVPEGRRLFGQLSVRENLILGAFANKEGKARTQQRFDEVLALMPASIVQGLARPAVTLSGGERQMLALGRALMSRPDVIVLDEPSLGLAPVMIDRVYEVLSALHRGGATVVVVEQMATHAMDYVDTLFVLDRGRLAYQGPMTGDAAQQALRSGYIGENTAVP